MTDTQTYKTILATIAVAIYLPACSSANGLSRHSMAAPQSSSLLPVAISKKHAINADRLPLRQSLAPDFGAMSNTTLPPTIDPIRTSAIVSGVFGSYTIPMRNFPVSARWSPILRSIQLCAHRGVCARESGFDAVVSKAKHARFTEQLAVVNAGVNRLIAYRGDTKVYGRVDYWAQPAETLTRGAGDCEDFAILKMAALVRLGIPTESMSLVVLQDTHKKVFHAILAVNTSSGSFILDNVRDAVLTDKQLPDYVPLYSFSAERAFVHGRKAGSGKQIAEIDEVMDIVPGEGPRAGSNTQTKIQLGFARRAGADVAERPAE